jgi:hypothetical protein
MYTLNINKMQQLPRGKDGRVAAAAKRQRLPQSAFEVNPFQGRGAWLRPTKGWISRNIVRMQKHGEQVQRLDLLSQLAKHRMLVEREERNKQKAQNL